MRDVGDHARAIDGCEEGHGAPCKGVLVTRNANDAQMGRRREIFDCLIHVRTVRSRNGVHLPVIAPPTAPHPVPPKFERMLCRKAA